MTSRRGFLALMTGAFVYEVAHATQRKVDALAHPLSNTAGDTPPTKELASMEPKQPFVDVGCEKATYVYGSSDQRTTYIDDPLDVTVTYTYDSCRRLVSTPPVFRYGKT